MEGEIKNLIKVWSSILASLTYCYFISSRFPKGKYRLLSLLPVFSLFTILPLHLTYFFPAAIVAFFITWIASFKLLLFSFDLGPLAPDPPKSLPLFITIACLPIRTKHHQIDHPPSQNPNLEKSSKSTKPTKLPLNLVTETVIVSLLMCVLHDYREAMHPKIELLMYCFMVFLLLDVLIALSNAVARALAGLELEPPSNEPYLSTSLQDFWGRRWNLTVTNTLRHTVYNPVKSASTDVLGQKWARLVAILATFLVSGLMHELLVNRLTRASPSWEMTGFFVLHGVCVVAEITVKKALSGRCQLHWAVSAPLIVGFAVATSFWLFFPTMTRNGAFVRMLEEFNMFMDLIKRTLARLV